MDGDGISAMDVHIGGDIVAAINRHVPLRVFARVEVTMVKW